MDCENKERCVRCSYLPTLIVCNKLLLSSMDLIQMLDEHMEFSKNEYDETTMYSLYVGISCFRPKIINAIKALQKIADKTEEFKREKPSYNDDDINF